MKKEIIVDCMKKLLLFTIAFTMSVTFISCSKAAVKNPLEEMKVSNLAIDDIAQFTYPGDFFNRFSLVLHAHDILDKTDNAYVQKTDEYSFAVLKFDNPTKYLFLLYNENDEIIDSIYTSYFYNQNDFDKLVSGESTAADVKNIDKTMYLYDFGDCKNSFHWLDTGQYISISYEKDTNVIESIELQNDSCDFYQILAEYAMTDL